MVLQRAVHTGHERRIISQIGNTYGAAADFIFVGGPDATTCCPDLGAFARGFLAGAVQFTVDRQDKRRVFRDHQRLRRNLNTLGADRLNLAQQMPRVEHNTVANDRQLATAHNTRRQRMQFVDCFAHHKCVACVVTALKAADDISPLAQPIYDFAFAFIAPLGADHDDVCHCIRSLMSARGYSQHRAGAKPKNAAGTFPPPQPAHHDRSPKLCGRKPLSNLEYRRQFPHGPPRRARTPPEPN